MKKFYLIFSLLLASCSSVVPPEGCPQITTPREHSKQYINNGSYDAFQITLSGHDSYCYTQSTTGQRYMVITPYFRVRRLEDSAVNSVDTSFYVKTIGKGNYIGTKAYSQSLTISPQEKEATIKGKSVSLRIAPLPYEDFSIETGLNLSEYAQAKSGQMFDIDYKYLSKQDLDALDDPIREEFLEIGSDETIVYCEKTGKPKVVKKGSVTQPCN